MKKLFAVCIVGLCLGTAVFANHPSGWGVGFVGNYGFSGDLGVGGAALSLKAPSLPIYWGIGLSLSTGGFGFGVTGDYYLMEGLWAPIQGDDGFGYFIGLGGYVDFNTWGQKTTYLNKEYKGNHTTIGLGARVPIGVNVVIPISSIKLEVFVDAAPHLGLGISLYSGNYYDYNSKGDMLGLGVGVSGEFGVRVWF
ncbi:MAG: hypothetical protein LBG76_10205 [Treponema sp.]|jgi:hypothetical protein|nr:hypothetical protein [Treponema sp.]